MKTFLLEIQRVMPTETSINFVTPPPIQTYSFYFYNNQSMPARWNTDRVKWADLKIVTFAFGQKAVQRHVSKLATLHNATSR